MRLLALSLLFPLASVCAQDAPLSIASPDGKIKVSFSNEAAGLCYRVAFDNREALAPSRIGLTADGCDFGLNSTFGKPAIREIHETYAVLGGHAKAVNDARELTASVTSSRGEHGFLDVRVQDDGVAWRFRLPAKAKRKIGQEISEWRLPAASVIWMQPDLGSYEGVFDGAPLKSFAPPTWRHGGSTSEQGANVPLPVTAELPGGGYALLTEAAVVDFADSASHVTRDLSLRTYMHAQPGGWTTDSEVVQPWRVLVLARDLNALVNTDFIANLNPPPSPELAGASWIEPGRSTWQWWATGGPKFQEQSQWLDWTLKTGFEYYLIDEGWKGWKEKGLADWALLKQVTEEAAKRGVKLWIWINSKDVAEHSAVVDFLDKAAALGIVGVKIDFIPRASREWSNWYVDVLREAAHRHLMVDFHGATKPTGIDRTWPNEINRESVRGHEYHISRYQRVQPPHHDTVLPFTRFVIGHADYTPTVFEPCELKGYTWPHELAQAIVLSAPYLCYADHPKNYLANPAFDVMREISSTWDETRVLPGSVIGECAAFARRKGRDWFIGILNGGQKRSLRIALDFLGEGAFNATLLSEDPARDDGWTRVEKKVSAGENLNVDMRPSSGYVARLKAVAKP